MKSGVAVPVAFQNPWQTSRQIPSCSFTQRKPIFPCGSVLLWKTAIKSQVERVICSGQRRNTSKLGLVPLRLPSSRWELGGALVKADRTLETWEIIDCSPKVIRKPNIWPWRGGKGTLNHDQEYAQIIGIRLKGWQFLPTTSLFCQNDDILALVWTAGSGLLGRVVFIGHFQLNC